ncbi:prephenate/arogenate dehydrogenase family protein [Paremcibacter congregatus]|jgi:cyclohexadieny/prephenate dehydrogenase|uniref:prephenate/arogenate dehydrogenase family protein n=1 Tax=Paremcibacter congregatus TaxID=2043170 RepID=UPI0030EC58F3
MTDFAQITLIGMGLIGSSLARAIRSHGLKTRLVGCDNNPQHVAEARALNLVDQMTSDPIDAVKGADLVILATPVGSYADLGARLCPVMKPGAILSDVGSVKASVVKTLQPLMRDDCHLIPGHPVAGTEQSGPKAGFSTLFDGRWCILTPPENTAPEKVRALEKFWQAIGSTVECMTPDHHDMVLAITSHLPHLIAYNIVGTARHLEEVTKSEVIKYSAGGFRDFTRIAASDPTMWRDVFLNNKDAVLEMLGRFTEDLTALQRSIRYDEGDKLFDLFDRTRRIRKQIIDAGQDEDVPDFGRHTDDIPD